MEPGGSESYDAVRGLLAEPYGCTLCDSGTPRNPAKGHQPDCPYERARAVLAAYDVERAALIHDICLQVNLTPPRPPGSTPAQDAPAPAPQLPTRYRLRYGVMECMTCGMAKDFCKGHAATESGAQDGDESGLAKRIAECQGK